MRSRRTRDSVTSTPQRSQMTPLCLIRLYFPHEHSQSRVGPKMRSQNRPPFSGLNVLYLIVSGFFTSPLLHERIASGDATLIATWSNPTERSSPKISRRFVSFILSTDRWLTV